MAVFSIDQNIRIFDNKIILGPEWDIVHTYKTFGKAWTAAFEFNQQDRDLESAIHVVSTEEYQVVQRSRG